MKIMDLLESLNFTSNIEWTEDVGRFVVDKHQYVITVRPASPIEQQTYTPFFGPDVKVGNVDFSLVLPGGEMTQDAIGIVGGSAFKVFSVVAQGVAELINKHGYDIVLCVAKQTASPSRYENRVSAYSIIVDRAARKAGRVGSKVYTTPTETVFAVYKTNMIDGMNKVKQHLQTL